MTKVLALNSSPRVGTNSKTELLLNSLVTGMRAAGASVEVINLHDKNIKHCVGCLTCFTKTPGVCAQRDDMDDLIPKWGESDIAIYAMPLYDYTMNATMKAFIERTLPSMEGYFAIHNNRMYHPVRYKRPAMVVLSVSGMPDELHFSALSAHMRYISDSPGRSLLAEIYRPAAEIITNPIFKQKGDDILAATEQAGRELIQSMKISPETMARITQPLIDPERYILTANATMKTCIAEGITMKEFWERKMLPRPDSIDLILFLIPYGINTSIVGDRKVVLQFRFSGEVKGSCHFTIDHGTVNGQVGTYEKPDLTIITPFEVWADIMTGKASGEHMLMEQKYQISGDPYLMQLFRRPE